MREVVKIKNTPPTAMEESPHSTKSGGWFVYAAERHRLAIVQRMEYKNRRTEEEKIQVVRNISDSMTYLSILIQS